MIGIEEGKIMSKTEEQLIREATTERNYQLLYGMGKEEFTNFCKKLFEQPERNTYPTTYYPPWVHKAVDDCIKEKVNKGEFQIIEKKEKIKVSLDKVYVERIKRTGDWRKDAQKRVEEKKRKTTFQGYNKHGKSR